MNLGDRLRLCRETHAFTQSAVSTILGVRGSTVSDYENSRCLPSVDMLIKLSELYNVSLDYIISGNKSKNPVVPEFQRLLDDITRLSYIDFMYVKGLVERLKQQ